MHDDYTKLKFLFLIFFSSIVAQDSTIVVYGDSNIFIIDSQDPDITLSYPNGGESFSQGESINAQWSAADNSFDNEAISIYIANSIGDVFTPLSENIANSGSESLEMPYNDQAFTRIKIVATDSFGNSNTDYSDGYFTVGNPENNPGVQDSTLVVYNDSQLATIDSKDPEVSLISPNGSEEIESGQLGLIQWTAEDDTFEDDAISIYLGLGIGSVFNPLEENMSNTGSTDVLFPEIDESYARAKIIAVDRFGNNSMDYSDGYFTIGNPTPPGEIGDSTLIVSAESNQTTIDSKDPVVQWISPNGGELLPYDQESLVNWTAEDDLFTATPISISFATNIGSAYESLSEPLENNGEAYLWLPELYTQNGRFKIEAEDQFGNSSTDESDGYVSLTTTGDINGDGAINIADIINIIQIILGEPITEYELFLADIDQNGIINIVDVVQMVHYILNQ